jgi:hypothetical protein
MSTDHAMRDIRPFRWMRGALAKSLPPLTPKHDEEEHAEREHCRRSQDADDTDDR